MSIFLVLYFSFLYYFPFVLDYHLSEVITLAATVFRNNISIVTIFENDCILHNSCFAFIKDKFRFARHCIVFVP